jgi:hypothetical protein
MDQWLSKQPPDNFIRVARFRRGRANGGIEPRFNLLARNITAEDLGHERHF